MDMFKGDPGRILPRFFWLFLAGFVAFVGIMAGIGALGVERGVLAGVFVAGTMLAYAAIGVLSPAAEADEWFVAGRRVPALFNGMAKAAGWVSGPVFIALAGGLFFDGEGWLAFLVGWSGGLLLMAILFAPYLRKSGCYTVPEFIATRYGGGPVRVLAVSILAVVAFAMLTAQLSVMGAVAELMLGLPYLVGIWVGLLAVLCCTVPGGMRSATWVQVAQYVVLAIAFVVPVVWISVAQGNGYLPQFAYGALERAAEVQGGMTAAEAPAGTGDAPVDTAAAPSAGSTVPDATSPAETTAPADAASADNAAPAEAAEPGPFAGLRTVGDAPVERGAPGAWRFMTLALCLTAGAAAMPHMLIRLFTADTARGAGRSVAWALLFALVFALSAPALATLTQLRMLDPELPGALVGQPVEQVAALDWVARWSGTDALRVADLNADGVLQANEIGLLPEVVTLGAPEIAGLPAVISGLVAAGGVAAAMSTAVVTLLALATAVGHDLRYGMIEPDAPLRRRLGAVRWLLVVIGILAGWLAMQRVTEPLVTLAWATSFAASGLFWPLVLAIWWRRTTRAGAIAGMVFGAAAGAIYAWSVHAGGMEPWVGLDAPRFGVVGMAVSLVAMLAVSLLTPEPDGEIGLLVDDIRRPYGPPLLPRTH